MSGFLSFDYPYVLIGFILFIPLVVYDILSPRNKRERNYLPRSLLSRLSASRLFFRIFLACFIIALAGPRWGLEQAADEYRRGLDAVIAVDVSGSMEIEDVPAYGENSEEISRLNRGLAIAGEAVAAVPGVRYAAVAGRGRGLLAVPLTWDNGAVLNFLESLESVESKDSMESIRGPAFPGRGTNLESLIDVAADAFQSSFPSVRTIILVSDGEALSGLTRMALDRCNREDISVIALAVGSDEGRPVPGLENTVSRRDAALMRTAAERSGGIYLDGNRTDAAALLSAHLKSLAPEAGTGGKKKEPKARWFMFVIAAITTYALSKLCLLQTRTGRFSIFGAVLLMALFFFPSCSQIPGKLLVMEANFLGSRGRYHEAVTAYLKALSHEEAAPYAEYGLGSVYYNLDEGKAALERFADSQKIVDTLSPEEHQELRYRISYNTGVVLFGDGDFSGAAASFREALRTSPGKVDAKRNLELSLLSVARESAASSRAEGGGEESESRAVLFEYLRQKEQSLWKSREWAEETPGGGPDY